jgi:hypothetical protein
LIEVKGVKIMSKFKDWFIDTVGHKPSVKSIEELQLEYNTLKNELDSKRRELEAAITWDNTKSIAQMAWAASKVGRE